MSARLIFVLICACVAGASSFYGSHLIHNNDSANTILITMFTVFAGFLVAVMVIIGDPSMIPAGSWRIAENRRDSIDRKLIRHMWLFWIYLIVIGLIFIISIFKDAKFEHAETINTWIEKVYFFMAIFSFLMTMALPKMVSDVQRARVDAEIERRRGLHGIKDD